MLLEGQGDSVLCPHHGSLKPRQSTGLVSIRSFTPLIPIDQGRPSKPFDNRGEELGDHTRQRLCLIALLYSCPQNI